MLIKRFKFIHNFLKLLNISFIKLQGCTYLLSINSSSFLGFSVPTLFSVVLISYSKIYSLIASTCVSTCISIVASISQKFSAVKSKNAFKN